MKKRNSFFALVLLVFLIFIGCKNTSSECKTDAIQIENRWYDKNGGIDYLDVKDKKDITFICSRINNFPEGKDVRIAYSYGYIDIYLNDRKIQAIFTVRNGVVYRVGIGKYAYDEALTKRIMKLLRISSRCWGEDCK
ncbi:hypothetical protein [Chryseobacterium sp. KMC2]|uniref:hypothetical protein n=1 Tax=Chryseobacterium sp. KMC2 TaxID=2800705 RepID=UPI00192507A2|nr:hypothetical protein [Chryseobacterium sp. KMC2]MBL3547936.1 hypothetical protein [Chryseobacterium sp. KMC2]